MAKVKLNDKANKKGKINIDKYTSEESQEVKKFIFILLGVIIVVLAVYGITRFINSKKDNEKTTNITEGAIDYDKVSVGTLLNKSDKEYYVIVYSGSANRAVYYSSLVTTYMNKEKSLPVYFCDLDNQFNKPFYVGENGESNKSAKSASEFAFKDLTLIKVKNGKVDKYIETLDTIKKELSI